MTRLTLPTSEERLAYELFLAEADRDRPQLLSPQHHSREACDAAHEALRLHVVHTREMALAMGGCREVGRGCQPSEP